MLAGLATWSISLWWEQGIGHTGLVRQLGAVFVPMTAATVIYGAVTLWSKVPPALEMGGLVLERLKLQKR